MRKAMYGVSKVQSVYNVDPGFINAPRIMTLFSPAQIYKGPRIMCFFLGGKGSCSGIFSKLGFLIRFILVLPE